MVPVVSIWPHLSLNKMKSLSLHSLMICVSVKSNIIMRLWDIKSLVPSQYMY